MELSTSPYVANSVKYLHSVPYMLGISLILCQIWSDLDLERYDLGSRIPSNDLSP